MPALDAFHAKVDAHRALYTPAWHRFADRFVGSLNGENPDGLPSKISVGTAEEFTRACASTLSLAETFYVSPTMSAIVTAAAADWAEDETVEAEDFPTDQGWLYVPDSIAQVDVRGAVYATSAVSWHRHGEAVIAVMWADKRHDPPHLRAHPGWDSLPRFTPWHVSHLAIGKPMPRTLQLGRILPPEVSAQVQWIETPQGMAMISPEGWDPDELVPHQACDGVMTWAVSALRIMQQPLASVERVGLPAGVRKGLSRHPKRVKNTLVTVIDFRRRLGEDEPGSGREFSHRFLRRGHWRRQWIGSEADGTRRQARIWIHPTICGPADRPLVLREHVNALSR